jgi:glycerate kinase
VVTGVAALARRGGTACVVLAGRVSLPPGCLGPLGISAAYSVSEAAGSEAASLAEPARHLAGLAEHVACLAGSH